jgi:hypothetical protein
MRLFKQGKPHRPKSQQPSIRGKISHPIPIKSPLDDEFPMRPGISAKASTTADDEFPIRSGAGLASPTPLATPAEPRKEQSLPTNHATIAVDDSTYAPTAADAPESVPTSEATPESAPEPEVKPAQEPEPAAVAEDSELGIQATSSPQPEVTGNDDEKQTPVDDKSIADDSPPEPAEAHAKTVDEAVVLGPVPYPPPSSAPPAPPVPTLAPQDNAAPEVEPEVMPKQLVLAEGVESQAAPTQPQPPTADQSAAQILEASASAIPSESPPRKPAHVRTSPPRRTSPQRRVSPSRRTSPPRRRSPSRNGPPVSMRRTNMPNTSRYSAASAASTTRTSNSKDVLPQRKKSTLRSAFSKLFGRRKKSTSQSSSEFSRMSALPGNSQHQSVGHTHVRVT